MSEFIAHHHDSGQEYLEPSWAKVYETFARIATELDSPSDRPSLDEHYAHLLDQGYTKEEIFIAFDLMIEGGEIHEV